MFMLIILNRGCPKLAARLENIRNPTPTPLAYSTPYCYSVSAGCRHHNSSSASRRVVIHSQPTAIKYTKNNASNAQ